MAYAWSHLSAITGAEAMYALKELLKAQGWTVIASGDGLAAYSGAGDVITSGAAGANGYANTRAWVLIEAPDGRQLTLQRGNSNLVWRLKYSYGGTFTAGLPGDATTTPAGADQAIFDGGGTDAAPSYTSIWPADGSYRFNCCADDAADYGFWAVSFPIGGGNANGSFIYEPLADTDPADGDIVAICTTTSSLTYTTLYSNASFFAWVPAAVPATWVYYPAQVFSDFGGVSMPVNVPTSPITSKDQVFPVLLVRRSALGNGSYKGRLVMAKWHSPSRTTGDTLTISSARDRIVFNDISLPWDGTVPAV